MGQDEDNIPALAQWYAHVWFMQQSQITTDDVIHVLIEVIRDERRRARRADIARRQLL